MNIFKWFKSKKNNSPPCLNFIIDSQNKKINIEINVPYGSEDYIGELIYRLRYHPQTWELFLDQISQQISPESYLKIMGIIRTLQGVSAEVEILNDQPLIQPLVIQK